MKILTATVAIFLLSVIPSSTGKTLILSNQNDTDISACVIWHETENCVAPGNESSIQLSNNATEYTVCWGKYDLPPHPEYSRYPFYYVYNATRDFDKFKNQVIVIINSTAFYRSTEEEKNNWEELPVEYWGY